MYIKHCPFGSSLSLSTLALSVLGVSLVACANAQDYSHDGSVYQFMEAHRQKSNINAMDQYEQIMQGSLFAMYPTYWRLNSNITQHDPDTINRFVQRYPNHVISEKLVADYAEQKAHQGDYASVRAVMANISNADDSEACAIALAYNWANDARALEQKEKVWLNTQIKHALCDNLALEMSSHSHISRTDRHEQLIRMMRIDNRQLSSRKPPLDKRENIISLARAYEQTGKGRQARQIYQNLTKNLDYYGLLARDRLNMPLTANDIGGIGMPNISVKDTVRIMQDPNFARAFKLMENKASAEHVQREWNWAVRTATDAGNHQLVLAAAKKAHEMGFYSRSIHAIQNSPWQASAISHPMPYQHSFMTHASSVGIDPAWAYGITRQESRFNANARSGVGAGGLMQIMPATAQMIARKIGSSGNANDPDTNIRYGTWYLSDKIRSFNGQIAPATAAYNAGTTPAGKWLPKHGTISADQYVEAIPYHETREYVKHVMENATIYGVMLGRYTPIGQRMGVVSPS